MQIIVFMNAYAKLCILQFWHDIPGKNMVHKHRKPLYTDTDYHNMALDGDSLHNCLQLDHKQAFYRRFHYWFPSEASEFLDILNHLGALRQACQCCKPTGYMTKRQQAYSSQSGAMVALCSKTHCCLAPEGQGKLSSKRVQKAANTGFLTYEAYCHILTMGPMASGFNCSIRTGHMERAGLSYIYLKGMRCTMASTWSLWPCEHYIIHMLWWTLLSLSMRTMTRGCSNPFACWWPPAWAVANPHWTPALPHAAVLWCTALHRGTGHGTQDSSRKCSSFYPAALQARGALSYHFGAGGWTGKHTGSCQSLWNAYLWNHWTDFLCSKFYEYCLDLKLCNVMSYAHLPIWACPWAKNL